jgi:hypothetical protein
MGIGVQPVCCGKLAMYATNAFRTEHFTGRRTDLIWQHQPAYGANGYTLDKSEFAYGIDVDLGNNHCYYVRGERDIHRCDNRDGSNDTIIYTYPDSSLVSYGTVFLHSWSLNRLRVYPTIGKLLVTAWLWWGPPTSHLTTSLPSHLIIMNLDGSNPITIDTAYNQSGNYSEPSCTGEIDLVGGKVLYVKQGFYDDDPSHCHFELWSSNLDGSGVTMLTTLAPPSYFGNTAFAPGFIEPTENRYWIYRQLFDNSPQTGTFIEKWTLDGSSKVTVFASPGTDWRISGYQFLLSKKQKRMYFNYSGPNGPYGDLWSMKFDGSDMRKTYTTSQSWYETGEGYYESSGPLGFGGVLALGEGFN